jgi:serine beta-lactamase-like protein LACTB
MRTEMRYMSFRLGILVPFLVIVGAFGSKRRPQVLTICLTMGRLTHMRKSIAIFLLWAALTDLTLAQATEQIHPLNNAEITPAKVEKIEAAIAAWMAQHKAPALSVAIMLDNQLALSKGYGLADLENSMAAGGDTDFRLASIAKSMTAIAVMKLVEARKIDLNAPVSKYCAAYPEKQGLKDAPDKKFSVTVRQLLIHQSGVRHNKLPDETLGTKHYNSITEAVGAFSADPLVIEPGTKYSYSTPGYSLLGCAIEGASGLTYIDYLRENIFKPAGMTRTSVDDVYAIIPNRARGYWRTPKGEITNAPLHDTSVKIPGGGLVSSAEDLAKFAIALNTNKLVKPETLLQMWTKPKASDGKEQAYAMGFLVNNENGSLRVFNDGSQAGTRTFLYLMPKEKFAIALMTNMQNAPCEELVPKIVSILSEK